MELDLDELLSQRGKALEIRTKVMSRLNEDKSDKGQKPRAPEETLALVILNVHRIRKAMEEGKWVFLNDDPNGRVIEYRG